MNGRLLLWLRSLTGIVTIIAFLLVLTAVIVVVHLCGIVIATT